MPPDLEDDDLDDWDDPSDVDDGESVTVPCPECGAEVYEDAERCPSCEAYIVHSISPWRGRPLWWVLLGLLGIGALIWALVGF